MTAEAQALHGLAAIPVDQVHHSPTNPRENLTDIDDLAASIREAGLIQPIVVQKIPGRDGYQIVAGHRRHAAVRKLGWPKIPALIRRDMLPDEELLAMLIENGQRADLDPIEEARAYRQLRDMGLSNVEVGRRVGRHANTVAVRLALLALPPAEQEEIRAGALSMAHVLGRASTERQQDRLRAGGRGRGRPKGVKTKPYFGDTHALAKAVRACDHRGRPKVGGVGCGECWEAAIRADVDSDQKAAS